MSTLDDWITGAAADLGLPTDSIPADLRTELLDITREVAHGVARIAGPLTCYLLGLAVAGGAEPREALAVLRRRLPAGDGTAETSAEAAAEPGGTPAVTSGSAATEAGSS